jgi:hypothetical protein
MKGCTPGVVTFRRWSSRKPSSKEGSRSPRQQHETTDDQVSIKPGAVQPLDISREPSGFGKLVTVTTPLPVDHEQYVQAAARNNAEWCDAVCRSHGLPGEFSEQTWTNARRTPPFYPDAVTLTATASAREVLARIDTLTPGCSVKDSFACLDLATADFDVLLDARWIHRPGERPAPLPPRRVRWAPVCDPDALLAWETAWGGGQAPTRLFRPELLTDKTVLVLAGYIGTRITAGTVANRTGSLIGISNLFTSDGDLDGAWAGGLATISQHFPHLPIVGYEHGEALDAAVRHGCTPTGPLRIWHRAR